MKKADLPKSLSVFFTILLMATLVLSYTPSVQADIIPWHLIKREQIDWGDLGRGTHTIQRLYWGDDPAGAAGAYDHCVDELFEDKNNDGKYDVNECVKEGTTPGVQSITPGQEYPPARRGLPKDGNINGLGPDDWQGPVETDNQGDKIYISIIDQAAGLCNEFYALIKEDTAVPPNRFFIGRCPYVRGRNEGYKYYTDQDGDGNPDRFVGTIWISKDDDDNNNGNPDPYDVVPPPPPAPQPGDDDGDGVVDRMVYIYIQEIPVIICGTKYYIPVHKLTAINEEYDRTKKEWKEKNRKEFGTPANPLPKAPFNPGDLPPPFSSEGSLSPENTTDTQMTSMSMVTLSGTTCDSFGTPLSTIWTVDESLSPEVVPNIVNGLKAAGAPELAAELGGKMALEINSNRGSSFSIIVPLNPAYDITFASVEKRVNVILDNVPLSTDVSINVTIDEFLTNPHPDVAGKIFLKGNAISVSSTTPANYTSYRIEINYYDVDYIAKGISESTLKPYRWTGTTWEELPSELDTLNNIITIVLPSLSTEFGVFGNLGSVPVSPLYLHAEASLIDLNNPECTQWHELHPYQCKQYHLQKWEDTNHDGKLSFCDQIALYQKPYGPKRWYHVEGVTVTIKVTKKPYLVESMYVEFEGSIDDFPWTEPNCTQWHEVYPIYSPRYHLEQWCDNKDGYLSPCDQIKLRNKDTGEWAEYHVDEVATDIIVKAKPIPTKTYYPSPVYVCHTTTFDASASYDPDGTIVSYTWDFGDGTPIVTEIGPITTHSYKAAETYTITLTVTDNDGLYDTHIEFISVQERICIGGITFPEDHPINGVTLLLPWMTPVLALSTIIVVASITTLYKRKIKTRKIQR